MSAANGNGTGAGPKDSRGDGKAKDDTIAKVTGVAIAAGIAYSLYKSFVAGKKTEEPVGFRNFDHAYSEPFHERITIEKPESVSGLESQVKDKAGELRHKTGEVKGAFEEKGKEVKSAIEGKNQEVKEWTADKAVKVKEGAGRAKDTGASWFRRSSGDAKKEVEEADKTSSGYYNKIGSEVQETVDAGKKISNEKKKGVEDGGSSVWNKVGTELYREKEELKKAAIEGERNIDDARAAVAGRTSETAHKVLPGRPSKAGEAVWSKTRVKGESKRPGGEYEIVRGDTLWSLSRKYGVTIDQLKTANGIWNVDYIVAGDTITIPK